MKRIFLVVVKLHDTTALIFIVLRGSCLQIRLRVIDCNLSWRITFLKQTVSQILRLVSGVVFADASDGIGPQISFDFYSMVKKKPILRYKL